MPRRRRIVVGVEGSKGSKNALRWAIEEAKLRGATVEVVTAFLPTYVPAAPDFGYIPLDPVDLETEVGKMQEDLIAEVLSEIDAGDVTIERVMVKGRAPDTLLKQVEGAGMLVVGSRGRGGFRGLLLGSVSQQLAQHATCPVVIIRPDIDVTDW